VADHTMGKGKGSLDLPHSIFLVSAAVFTLLIALLEYWGLLGLRGPLVPHCLRCAGMPWCLQADLSSWSKFYGTAASELLVHLKLLQVRRWGM